MMEPASQNHERAIVIADTSRSETKNDNDIGKLSLSQFPDELILEILSYLDVDDLLIASRLGQRPSIKTLVEKNVLPKECYGHGKVAPGLVGIKRKVERERVKDGLRAWVEGWKGRVGEREREVEGTREGKVEVRWLVRRFARRDGNESVVGRGTWGRKVERRELPARAKVLGLRRFWERVGKEGVGVRNVYGNI
ncbi:hypothetical protein SS1G_02136 [Sclerotinia sclerotiorum 1980 UF-70]|uniref:F-box domain-containing protein n=1 Tax=Sclerotinia sclerotiorum (strain ATCC 18683 / 1980 / Ss-1) TaxID=665079 RepID=A7EA06_SCLS1|nr:hypothetical protein SS1G_02136 [Sclerotinia sclerotiorum 1980 UF-70]EDN99284.1 hypothetical protein SS1G_02136 [Sclerotinia sclerotiorum 1980 UF-70]